MHLLQRQKDQLEEDILRNNMLYVYHEFNPEFDNMLKEMPIEVNSLHVLGNESPLMVRLIMKRRYMPATSVL